MDYFQVALPYAGVLSATTSGPTDTQGQLWQDAPGETQALRAAAAPGAPPGPLQRAQSGHTLTLVAADTDSGTRRNFQLGEAVAAGTYYLAVSAGTSGSGGAYTLEVQYSAAQFENPRPASPQSGLGVLSGWVCDADSVVIEFARPNDVVWQVPAAYGTLRTDTESVCGDSDNGFGLLWNWNKLGPGTHTVRAVVDGIVLPAHPTTVTTLGLGELPLGLSGKYDLADFPVEGETTTVQWEQALQNFVIASVAGGGEGMQLTPAHARLENPQPGSFQSGIGVISGWVCDADLVEIVFENETTGESTTVDAGYGTVRTDTAPVCGDRDNGWVVVELEQAGRGPTHGAGHSR